MKKPLFILLALACFSQPLPAKESAPATPAPVQDRLMLGAGWPDLRLRGQVWGPVDLEAKAAIGSDAQAYSGRLYWRAYQTGFLTFIAGAEGGVLSFSGIEGLSGSGSFYEPFVGAQARFAPRWSAQVDAGPAFLQTSAAGASVGYQAVVLNAAIYFSLF